MLLQLLSNSLIYTTVMIKKTGVITCFLLSFVLILAVPGGGADQLDMGQLTEQERWVLNQINEGQEADLEHKFGGPGRRHYLRAAFLEKLIMGGFDRSRLNHNGIQIAHATIEGPLNLKYIEVDHPLALSHCFFENPVTLQESHFKKDLSLNGCKFVQAAHFQGIKVDGNVFCNDAVFEQDSLWNDAKIGEKFQALRTIFRSNEAKADFYAMKVGTNAFFSAAAFYGPADFGLVHIGRQLNFNKAEFFNNKTTVNFVSLKVEQIAYFKEVRFHGAVDFAIAQIGMQFNADDAEFFCREKLANFSGIKVGNTIYFQRAEFHGPVKFEFAEIGVNFRGTEARFINESQRKNFSRMKVNHKVFLDKSYISGPVDMSYGDFYDLDIQGLRKVEDGEWQHRVNISQLNLRGTVVQRELTIANAGIDDLDASNLQVKGPAQFIHSDIRIRADFRNSFFQCLDFREMKWPDKDEKTGTRQVYLNDMTYSSISIDRPNNCDYTRENFLEIMDFLEASPFNTQSYIQLETFFKRIGREPWANEVFIRMHDRDLATKLAWWDPRRWLEWFFWGVLAGYGRAPFRVIFISLLFIIIGALVYDPVYLHEDMRHLTGKPYKSVIMRCFLSLDRFLPLELGLGKHWNSRASHFLVWLYFYLELILGWILIPIALASIYTQIK